VRRPLKFVLWTGAFLAAAGVGAYLAAHTDPFPPGVEDPGERSSPTPTPSPDAIRWGGTLEADTVHELLAGHSCTTSWNASFSLAVGPTDRVTGSGVARLNGRLRCGFPVAQVQAKRLAFSVRGRAVQDALLLRFVDSQIMAPAGAGDFAGFVSTVLDGRTFRAAWPSGDPDRASLDTSVEVPDAEGDGRLIADVRLALSCSEGCG
jgi:hypothetical protein